MKYTISLTYLLLLIQTSILAQSGWTREKGGAFVQASVNTFGSNDFYSVTGDLFDQGDRFQSQVLTIYGEYGITNRITGIVNLPLYKSNRFSGTERVGGVSDIRIGAKYALSQKLPISFAIEAEIPTGDGFNFANVQDPIVPGERINLPISDGEFNVWSTLAVSQSLPSGNTYGSLYGQYNLRTQGFSDQYRLGLELGQRFIDRLWLIGRLGIQESVSDDIQPTVSFLYGEGTTYTTYGFTGMYSVNDQWMITAAFNDYGGFITDRQNIYDGTTWSLGVAFEIK
ncbi:MAG: hypothetical protein ACFB15_31740 [Cyclobacteriaceae bacterium]